MGIPAEIRDVHWRACGLDCPVLDRGTCRRTWGLRCSAPECGSAAAEILSLWTVHALQDDECGTVNLGNGWHALFRRERAVLRNIGAVLDIDLYGDIGSQRSLCAFRFGSEAELDEAWLRFRAGAAYPPVPPRRWY
ncbi:hypothetical protein [Streptomyces sp. NPDC049881]|uniref:hypothetical protein n=1 Tax=unclassified Streptomyces TaxID=2593676 RepID=UPI003443740A